MPLVVPIQNLEAFERTPKKLAPGHRTVFAVSEGATSKVVYNYLLKNITSQHNL